MTPHNVWDKWIELYGRNLDAFYPVADTAIGRLGFLMANGGSYPENAPTRSTWPSTGAAGARRQAPAPATSTAS